MGNKSTGVIAVKLVLIVITAAILLAFASRIPSLQLLFPRASTTINGTLVRVVSESVKGSSTTQSYVQSSDGTLTAVPESSVKNILSGSLVSVSAPATNTKLLNTSYTLVTPTSISTSGLAVPLVQTTGSRKIAVLPVDFQNLLSQPTAPTKTQMTSVMDGPVKTFFSENSFGKMSVVSTVFDRTTLSISSSCDLTAVATNAVKHVSDEVDAAHRLDLRQYQHLVLVYPGDCGYSGVATTGGGISVGTLSFGSINIQIVGIPESYFNSSSYGSITHELGHNLGATHSQGMECGSQVFSGFPTCTEIDYGDPYDDMGGATYHFGGYIKEHIGWLSSSNITEVTQSGTYTIQAIETSTTLPQVLKIRRKNNADTSSDWFYVENRVKTGIDSTLSNSAVSGGLLKYIYNEPASPSNSFNHTYLIDTTPNSTGSDFQDAALLVNQTFTDSVSGISIKPTSKTGNALTVQVTIPTAVPTVNIIANNLEGPITIQTGNTASLSWSSANVSSCTASGDWAGTKGTSGTEQTPVLTATQGFVVTKTYTLTCGASVDTVIVLVNPVFPSVDVKANGSDGPITVTQGSTVDLTWVSNGVSSCTANGDGWSGTRSTSGSETSQTIEFDTTFTLKCGAYIDTVTVLMATGPVPSVNLKANGSDGPITVAYNSAASLSWTSANATSCTASGAWSGSQAINGSFTTSTLTQSSNTFTLNCGGAVDSVTVNVTQPPSPTVDLLVNGSNGPVTVAPNDSVTLSWTSTNATLCNATSGFGWAGTKAASGSLVINGLTSNTVYTLTCDGTATDSVTVNVVQPNITGARRVRVVSTVTGGKKFGVIGYYEANTTKYQTIDTRCNTMFSMAVYPNVIGGCQFVPYTDWALEDYSSQATALTAFYSKAYYTTKAGPSFPFETISNSVDIFTVNGPDRGTADVYVDGVKRGTINNAASSMSVNKYTLNLSGYAVKPYIFLKVNGSGGEYTDEMTNVQKDINIGDTPYGTGLAFQWSTFNASSCSASGAWSGAKAVNGEEYVIFTGTSGTPSKLTTSTYTLNCVTAGGQTRTTNLVASVRGAKYFVTAPNLGSTFTKGQTVVVGFSTSEPDTTAATYAEGYRAKVFIYPYIQTSQLPLVSANATYGTSGWTASVKMPTTAGKYRIRIGLSCAIANSVCDRLYLGYFPFYGATDVAGVSNFEKVINVQ